MYRRFGLPVTRRFFSSCYTSSRAEQRIQNTFSSVSSKPLSDHEKRYYSLLEYIITDEYKKAKHRAQEHSKLFELVRALPASDSNSKNLETLCKCLAENPVKPVMTSHPTRVLSNAAIVKLFNVVDAALKYDVRAEEIDRKRLDESLHWLLTHPVRQIRHLTPQEESKYGLFVYQKILESFPSFLKQLSDYFVQVHGGDREEVIAKLKSVLMISYQPYSWIPGDADGNYNVTAETMKQIVPARQIAILELYQEKLEKILLDVQERYAYTTFANTIKDNLKNTIAYFESCIEAIRVGIWFDEAGSQTKIEEVKRVLTRGFSLIDPELAEQLSEFITLMEIAGFFGGTKEYVRQTTFVNQTVFNELLQILKGSENEHIYDRLSEHEKQSFHKLLGRDPAHFLKIKEHRDKLSVTAKRELERLSFILKHRDIFPFYICSDTKSKMNFDEVRILMHLAAFLDGNLCIGQMKRFPINFLFLCETPEDIHHFSMILTDILKDPSMRARIIESGFISYVSGPSDLGKTGGIATHLALYDAQSTAQTCLDQFKVLYPELKDVKLRVLHGYGGDMKRRIKRAGELEHATFQGLDAYDELGAPGAYSAYLHRVLGRPSISCSRVKELQQIQATSEVAYQVLQVLESLAIEEFQSFFEKDAAKNLLRTLTHPELERAMNMSSRAGSKKASSDITQVRAIGLVNLYLLTGVQWDIFMSVAGWVSLSPEHYNTLPVLYEGSIVVRDIVDKVLFVLAVSDMPRAWRKIQSSEPTPENILAWSMVYEAGDGTLENHHTLAYLEKKSRDILRILIRFMPESVQSKMVEQFEKLLTEGESIHILALSVIKLMPAGSRFYQETVALRSRYHLLTACIDAFEQDKETPHAMTNVVLACRAIGIAKGPDCIGNTTMLSKDFRYEKESQPGTFSPGL